MDLDSPEEGPAIGSTTELAEFPFVVPLHPFLCSLASEPSLFASAFIVETSFSVGIVSAISDSSKIYSTLKVKTTDANNESNVVIFSYCLR